MTDSIARPVQARVRLCAAIALGLLCSLGMLLALDPGAFSAAPAKASPGCLSTVVTTTADSGFGSLREKVSSAAAGGVVAFCSTLANATIVLTTTEIVVTQMNITIDGSGAAGVSVDGNSAHRVFNVTAPLTMISLTVQNGNVTGNGAGLFSSSVLTLTNVSFLSNTATALGGGADATGAATLNGGLFQNNTSTGGSGGGLWTLGTLVLTGTQFLGNTAVGGGGGAVAGGAATLNGGLFQNNRSMNIVGGGLWAQGRLVLTGTNFLSNTASSSGGGLYANNTLVLKDTQFLSNTATLNGGGAYAAGAATLNGGLFQNNQCTAGGCLSGGWYAATALTLTQFLTTSDNIQNNGLTTQAAGDVILFNGSNKQTIAGTGSTTIGDLWANNTGAGVWLGQDVTVTNRLTLTSDLTTTGSYTLNLTANASSAGTGDVWGTTYRGHAFVAGVTYPFGNPNVAVDFTSGTPPAAMTVDLTHTVPAGANFGIAVKRYYDISQAGASGFTATLRLHYGDDELQSNTEGSLQLWHYPAGGPWLTYTVSAFDTTENWIESNAVTNFSPWVLSQNSPSGPTAVRLESCGARAAGMEEVGSGWEWAGAAALLGLGAVLAGVEVRQRRGRRKAPVKG